MASGYLEEYGAGEERRQNLIRNSILIGLGVIIAALFLWFLFRYFHETTITKHFLNALKAKDYNAAYTAWGCTSAHTCADYTMAKFMEDWGPQSKGGANQTLKITDTERCGNGVIVSVDVAPGREDKLFVEQGSDSLSFSPVATCPGKGPWAIMLHRTLGRVRTVLY